MITSEQAERKRFALWYNTHWDVEMITGQDDIDAAWEIWKAALSEIPARPVGYVGLSVEGEPTKFRAGSFGSGHPVYMSPVAAAVPEGWQEHYEEAYNAIFAAAQTAVPNEAKPDLAHEAMKHMRKLRSSLAITTETPGDGWVKCSERLPTEADADCDDCLWVCWYDRGWRMEREYIKSIDCEYFAWKPTGLKRPTPPVTEGA